MAIMKVKNLISLLQAKNPEADLYICTDQGIYYEYLAVLNNKFMVKLFIGSSNDEVLPVEFEL